VALGSTQPLTEMVSYLLISWCRVLLEQLTDLQLVKKFPAFHWTRRFITALTSVGHLSLSWASPIQSIYPHPTCCRSILILPVIFPRCKGCRCVRLITLTSLRADCLDIWETHSFTFFLEY